MGQGMGSWRSSGARLVFVLFVTRAVGGCAYATPSVHVPESVPPLSVAELTAAEITVVDAKNGVDHETEGEVKSQTASILSRARRPAGTSAGATRMLVRVELVEHEQNIYDASLRRDGCAVMGMAGVPVGQIVDRERLSVDVTLQDAQAGLTYKGSASANEYGSIYAHARRRALARALDRALADAATHPQPTL
ncbi:MAG: hypothetical protein JWM74_3801 [Myxococcaceae bacterium]|nr:hypothetical protein [Myxococcaceae bacterium]